MKKIIFPILICAITTICYADIPLDEMIDNVTTRQWQGKSYPILPTLSTELRSNIKTEIASSQKIRIAYEKLNASSQRNVTWFEGIAELEQNKAIWCLLSCLCHPSEDVQIHALRSLKNLNDKRTIPFLLIYAEYMAVFEGGSENATIHGIIHKNIAETLSSITGIEVKLDGQNPEELKKAINKWHKWLIENNQINF